MRGGYLTIDLSNVHGDINGGTLLAVKKGLHRYLEKNTKPIYFIFSDDILKYIVEYSNGSGESYTIEPNQHKTFLLPCFIDTNNPGRFYFNLGCINKDKKINESANVTLSYLESCSLYLRVDENDELYLGEL